MESPTPPNSSTSSLDPIDFFLAIGDDRSDEIMFETLEKALLEAGDSSASLFTCTVGRKSSAARWFLPWVGDVLSMLLFLDIQE